MGGRPTSTRKRTRSQTQAQEQRLDELLHVLGNPTRLKILQRIAAETHYPLQLARELRISQQAVTKHLRVLEQRKLVEVIDEPSTVGGPPRKSYYLTSGFTLTMSVGPQVFQARMAQLPGDDSDERVPVDPPAPTSEVAAALAQKRLEQEELLDQQFRKILAVQNLKERIVLLQEFVEEVNAQLAATDRQRDTLVRTKRRAMTEASAIISQLYQDYYLRNLLYTLLATTPMTVAELAARLQLREGEVEELLARLREDQVLATAE